MVETVLNKIWYQAFIYMNFIVFTSYYKFSHSMFSKYRIFRPIRRTFFPRKMWPKFYLRKYYFQNYKYPYIYYTTSLSWDSENSHEDDFSGSEDDFPGFSSSKSSVFHRIRPLVDLFRSHASRSLFNGLPWFLLPVGEYCFITTGNLLRGILFTWCIHFLFYSCSLSKTGFFLIPLQFVYLFCNLSKCVLLFFSCTSSLLLLFFWCPLL